MSYLLDTHAFIWALTEPQRLSAKVRSEIQDPSRSVFVSAVTFWEISLKFGLGKLHLTGIQPEEFPAICKQTGFDILPLDGETCASYHLLVPSFHKDPFDKMLLWIAKTKGYTLISKDESMQRYRQEGVAVLW
ncbi:MAG: hypothetical protein KIPDCIKN_03588 [Haliscomenobacter sp.]|jgi:PIN domain nuclease of toxin-antitoxin system|nr:hypothetical protein [Haliscomenobacter sp.]